MEAAPGYDITLFGATGFVGRLTAAYLHRRCREEGLTLCLAGRKGEKLADLASRLAEQADGHAGAPATLLADSENVASLRAMARRSRVICSTVGPYARYGTPVVEAAVREGSDYCDLTGEVQWMRRSADTFAGAAEAAGVRIVHACGFDSVPSDLGVYLVQKRLIAETGEPAPALRLRLHRQEGGVSRGTLESMVGLFREAASDATVRALLTDPHSLEPHWSPDRGGGETAAGGERVSWKDGASGGWQVPFLMEEVNRRVVYRTNALSRFLYGRDFRYNEVFVLPPGIGGFLKALAGRSAITAGRLLFAFPPTRSLLVALLFPPPGSGPRVAEEGGGYFEARIEDPLSGRAYLRIEGDRDPGYGATAIMLGESAILLAAPREPDSPAGVITPAVAFGEALPRQLSRQGVRFLPTSSN
ncbi:MAG: saccharopine dehydrogenase family protein [Alkalispirochaetaceae bacterium]